MQPEIIKRAEWLRDNGRQEEADALLQRANEQSKLTAPEFSLMNDQIPPE